MDKVLYKHLLVISGTNNYLPGIIIIAVYYSYNYSKISTKTDDVTSVWLIPVSLERNFGLRAG
jgi:hypothetical protein